jgi:hypothetical protein
MKKIQFKSLSWTEAGLLWASLRRQLIAQHPDIKEMGGQVLISEAWKLDGERTKIKGSVRREDGSHWHFTRIINPER